jgi:hypothetical protein
MALNAGDADLNAFTGPLFDLDELGLGEAIDLLSPYGEAGLDI